MKFIMTIVILLAALVGLSLLFAYPTMWLVNSLFSTAFIQFIFGVAALNVWKAWMLNILVGTLFNRSSGSKD